MNDDNNNNYDDDDDNDNDNDDDDDNNNNNNSNNKQTTEERKEDMVLFNDRLNTFYLRFYGDRTMVKGRSDSERENPLPPLHGLLFD